MHRFIALALAVTAGGCFFLPRAHGLKGGETLHVAEDSFVLEVMGDSLRKEDHRKASRGRGLPVVAAGATVRVAADYQQQRELNAPNAPLVGRNPWILVEVVESPVAVQRGWKGWIHLDTTSAKPVTAPPTATTSLPRASLLCPYADVNELACNVNLAANTAVRVIGCAGPRVDVELWTDKGAYVHGFVNVSQFPSNPCLTASVTSRSN